MFRKVINRGLTAVFFISVPKNINRIKSIINIQHYKPNLLTMKKLITILLIAGSSYFVMGQDVKINTNLVVETDGTLRMDNTATVWDDLMVFPGSTNSGGSKVPGWGLFKKNGTSQGVFLWWFDSGTEEEVYFTVQIPHSYNVGTNLFPHVHWTTETGTVTPSSTNVQWGLEYTIVAIGGSFSNTTIITTNGVIPSITITGSGQHLISAFDPIVGTNFGISTVLVCRLFRVTNTGYEPDAGLLGIDFHFEKNTVGSHTEYIK